MSAPTVGRPTAEEHIPYYDQYIRLVPDGGIVDILAGQITGTRDFLARLTPEEAAWRPAPGEWSATAIVGHLADTERVFAYRALRLARGDATPPAGVEFEDYAAVAGYGGRALADVVAEFAAVRAATVALLRGLGAAAWARRAPEEWTCRSVRAFAYALAGHEIHHLDDIRRRHPGEPGSR